MSHRASLRLLNLAVQSVPAEEAVELLLLHALGLGLLVPAGHVA